MPNIDELEKLLKQNQELIKLVMQQKGQKKKTTRKGKKTTSKKETVKKQIPKLPYSETNSILQEMKVAESISRFGILWNAENPYNISSKAIEKFYNDYNIDKRFKKWHMSYSNKDTINNNQLQGKEKKVKQVNLENRIKQIESKLKGKHKGKSTNQVDKITDFLVSQLEKLEEQLGEL